MSIRELYIDAVCAEETTTRRFSRALGLEPTIIASTEELFQNIKSEIDPWNRGKQILLLTHNKSTFLKECPGTREYTCCGYKILHIGSYCTMDCSYCILQSYFHPPMLHFFTNHQDLFAELDRAFELPVIQRIGTGEFTDSLIWEKWTDLTQQLVERFSAQDHAVLELKTKTTAIGQLKDLAHNRKTIVSWSLNTPDVIASEERRTTSLSARLKAAAQCQQWGYPLAFHFDPMVIYPGCEDAYHDVLKQLFASVSAHRVVWISLGTMRFMPALKSVIGAAFYRFDHRLWRIYTRSGWKNALFQILTHRAVYANGAMDTGNGAGGNRLSMHGGRSGLAQQFRLFPRVQRRAARHAGCERQASLRFSISAVSWGRPEGLGFACKISLE